MVLWSDSFVVYDSNSKAAAGKAASNSLRVSPIFLNITILFF
jgi:hypothetical protein